MTPCYARLLALVALIMLMASGPAFAQTDYDRDNDNLIDITTLPQLNAIRWDLNGDGAIDASATSSDTTAYNAAFSNAASGMGCQSTCTGYELLNNLDFDTDGNGSTYSGTGTSAMGDSGDDYYNDGSGWAPIGRFDATFKGNGYIISNLFIKRTTTSPVGLFGTLDGNDRVESVGVKNAYVYGRNFTGILVGTNHGTVAASWSTGSVLGDVAVGGLVGQNLNDASSHQSTIIASYSRAAVHAIPSFGTDAYVGGLVGSVQGNHGRHARVIACYSTGAVTSTVVGRIGGLTALFGTTSITASYWDTQTSGRTSGGGGTGQMTTTLKAKTDYTGIYANWNVDVDGVTGNDNPWDFGTSSQYPVLKYGGHSLAAQGRPVTDYDTDNDRLIDITTLAQLNAIRWDLNGDGAIDASATTSDTTAYNTAFSNRDIGSARMGCPSGTCTGYELLNNLNFDQNNDGEITAADTTYWNSGAGWAPIGSNAAPYTATFEGNGKTISHLYINRNINYSGFFASTDTTAHIRSLGLVNAVINTGQDTVGALVGLNKGRIAASYVTGSVTANTNVGGLVGTAQRGSYIVASYATAPVVCRSGGQYSTGSGLVGGNGAGATIASSYSTGSVTGACPNKHGLTENSGSVTDSYWDTQESGIADDGDTVAPEGKLTADLQSVTSASGIYANWDDLTIDASGANDDDPWTFGTTGQYPVLKFADMDTTAQYAAQPMHYDTDSDGFIEVSSLAQLNAVRWDLNGDGAIDARASTNDTTTYNTAFPSASVSKGCPATGCTGYELAASLDFDSDSDGDVDANDHSGAYWNSGTGWTPIGTHATRYAGNFKGNGHIIDNLFISRSGDTHQGLFGVIASGARTETLGATNANVTGGNFSGILFGANHGAIVACYTTGNVTGPSYVGGLTGWTGGSISTSYSTAYVSGADRVGGLVGTQSSTGSITNSYSTGRVNRSSGSATTIGGLLGSTIAGAGVTASYYDTSTSGCVTGGSAGCTTSAGGTGYATADLQHPNDYIGIYSSWNANLDGQAGNDDPWTFGAMDQYPALKYAGMDTTAQFNLQPVVVTLTLTPSSISENGGMSTVTATLARSLSAATTITVRPVAGAYTVPADSTITIAAGQTANASDTVVITAVNNTQDEPNRTVTISAVMHNSQVSGRVTGATLTLEDDDLAPMVTLMPNPASISENGAVSTVTASLSRPSSAATTITVRPVASAYTVAADSTITIAAGDTINASDTVVITAVNNTQDAPNRIVTLSAMSRNAQGAGSVTGASLTLTDDEDAPDVTMVLSPASISEDGGVSTVTATLSHTSSDPTTITVTVAPVSPTVASDYMLSTPATLTVAAGQTTSTGTVTITGVNNADATGNKTVTVSSTPTNSVGTGSVTDVTLTLVDDDVPNVTLVLTPASITENAQVSTITATLDRTATAAATVTVSAMAVSPAVAGDFTLSTATTLTFAANVTTSTGSVTITSVNDTTDAPDKEVTVSATVTGGNMAVLSSSETLTITDDDAPPRLSISSPSAVEGTALTFTVRLNAVSGKAVTVAYADAGTGTATSGTDYTALTAGTLTFAAGTTSQTFAISVTGDSDDEPNETVEVTLSNAVNATFDGGATSLTGTGTIIDDDGMPALSIGSPSVIEGATSATLTFRVYLRPAHNTLQVTVAYADAGTGSATSGTDYTALTAGTLTFAASDTIQTIPVSVTDDSDDEQNETVIVTLSSATNATISTAQGTGTIIDDETSSANLDVDGDGRVRLFSDIILVIRYVLFFREEALLRGNVIEPTATRTTAQEIEPYLDTLVNQNVLDVDGDGDVRLFSDIILIIRYVLFFRNEALLRGNVIEQNATRTTAQAIEPYIRSLYPASHFQ